MPVRLEVCCENLTAVRHAKQAGAYRVELCRDLKTGGLTPNREDIVKARAVEGIKLNVLIRPREGDFVYSTQELDRMNGDIRFCGESGCDGVVIGALGPHGTVDKEAMAGLIDTALRYFMSITFHRAFDESFDLIDSMEDCIALGCDRILTSGGRETAFDGMPELKELIERSEGRIIIMPGCGVTPENIDEIANYTGCNEIHGSFQGSLEKMKEAVAQISHYKL